MNVSLGPLCYFDVFATFVTLRCGPSQMYLALGHYGVVYSGPHERILRPVVLLWRIWHSYDVALWASIADFPYSWLLWQRYATKFVATNLVRSPIIHICNVQSMLPNNPSSGTINQSNFGTALFFAWRLHAHYAVGIHFVILGAPAWRTTRFSTVTQ